MTISANSRVLTGTATADVENAADRAVVLEHQDVRVDDVVDVDVVPDPLAILVQRGHAALAIVEAEDPAGARSRR